MWRMYLSIKVEVQLILFEVTNSASKCRFSRAAHLNNWISCIRLDNFTPSDTPCPPNFIGSCLQEILFKYLVLPPLLLLFFYGIVFCVVYQNQG